MSEARPATASQCKDRLTTSIQSRNTAFHGCDRRFSRTPRSAPHFTRTLRSNRLDSMCSGRCGNDEIKGHASTMLREEEHLVVEGYAMIRVWGSPWNWREPPENWSVGCETSCVKTLTHGISFEFPAIDTDTFKYLLYFDKKAFIAVRNQMIIENRITHLDGKQDGPARYVRSVLDILTCSRRTSDT